MGFAAGFLVGAVCATVVPIVAALVTTRLCERSQNPMPRRNRRKKLLTSPRQWGMNQRPLRKDP